MTKQVTLERLLEQLTELKEKGYGNALMWYRNWDSMDEEIEEGVWDIHVEENGTQHIFLG